MPVSSTSSLMKLLFIRWAPYSLVFLKLLLFAQLLLATGRRHMLFPLLECPASDLFLDDSSSSFCFQVKCGLLRKPFSFDLILSGFPVIFRLFSPLTIFPLTKACNYFCCCLLIFKKEFYSTWVQIVVLHIKNRGP